MTLNNEEIVYVLISIMVDLENSNIVELFFILSIIPQTIKKPE